MEINMSKNDKRPTLEQKVVGAMLGWSGEALERGYVVSDFDGTGLLEINAVGGMGVFDSDEEAVEQAIRDGYRFIPVEELPNGFDRRYLGWLDTPENREAIAAYTLKYSVEGVAIRYLSEASFQLVRAGFEAGDSKDGYLPISWEGAPLCRVTGGGGVRYDVKNIEGDERNEAFHKLLDITSRVSEYMRLMEQGPRVEATGLHEDFRLLAEFNGIVLAGHKYTDAPGHQFATWERDYDCTGVIYGHYTNDFIAAKEDFATRSGLVQKDRQFTDEQLSEVYRCIHETLDSEYPITPERENVLKETAEQIGRAVPDLEQRVEQSNQKELLYNERTLEGPMMG